MRYPSYVYSPNEDVTRENMRQYEQKQNLLYKKCEEIAPDYWQRSCRERFEIREKAKGMMK